MSFVIVAASQDGRVFVGGDAQGKPFATRAAAELVSAEHYGWVKQGYVFGKARVVGLSAFASPDDVQEDTTNG